MCQLNDDSFAHLAMTDSLEEDTCSELSVSLPGSNSRRSSNASGRRSLGSGRRRRSSGGSIMKTSTLDESISSMGTSSRRSSSCRMPVSFDIVEIHEHAIILDESRNGPALTIDWKPMNTEVTTVQEFDCTRCHSGKVRLLDTLDRVAILINAGYSKEDLCDHFAEDVEKESSASKMKDSHPSKQQQQKKEQQQQQKRVQQQQPQKKEQPKTQPQPQPVPVQPQQKKCVIHKMKKVAKKLKKQMAANAAA